MVTGMFRKCFSNSGGIVIKKPGRLGGYFYLRDTARQRAGLVKNNMINFLEPLESGPVSNNDSLPEQPSRANNMDYRDCQTKRTGQVIMRTEMAT